MMKAARIFSRTHVVNDLGKIKRSLHLSRLKETAIEKCTKLEPTTNKNHAKQYFIDFLSVGRQRRFP